MISAANAAGLVAGGAQAPAPTVSVRVLRAFLWKGVRQEPGTIIQGIDPRAAVELVQWNKAELVAAPEPAAGEDPAPEGDPEADPAAAGADEDPSE